MNDKDYIKHSPLGGSPMLITSEYVSEGGGLTEHFSLNEFVRSSTADKLGIKNEPTTEAVENLRVLCKQILEPLRRFANKPLHINSGYRCSVLNMAVGGAKTSNHLYGFAADIRCDSWQECLDWQGHIMLVCDFDECICERHGNSIWLHVAYRNNQPQRHRAFEIKK